MKNHPFQPVFGGKGEPQSPKTEEPARPPLRQKSQQPAPQAAVTQLPPVTQNPKILEGLNNSTLGKLGIAIPNNKTLILILIIILVLFIMAVFIHKQKQQEKAILRLKRKLRMLG